MRWKFSATAIMSVSLSVAALPMASTPVMGTRGGGGVATEDCGGELAGKEDVWKDMILKILIVFLGNF